MSLGVTNGMNGIVGSSPIVSSSTTTTFYSGVKLAPPVQSASIEELGRRSGDQKSWSTILQLRHGRRSGVGIVFRVWIGIGLIFCISVTFASVPDLGRYDQQQPQQPQR
ncbi:hypothetical protein CPB97_007551 [Podila verticillata]|nr:hypothetical protein CPB97_007551 [Podila verticillata]